MTDSTPTAVTVSDRMRALLENFEKAVYLDGRERNGFNPGLHAIEPRDALLRGMRWDETVIDQRGKRIRELQVREDFQPLVTEIREWQHATFPHATPAGAAAHLLSEAKELAEAPTDAEEMADVFMLLVCIAGDTDLLGAVRRKFEINKARKWGARNAEGFVEHVREDRSTPESLAAQVYDRGEPITVEQLHALHETAAPPQTRGEAIPEYVYEVLSKAQQSLKEAVGMIGVYERGWKNSAGATQQLLADLRNENSRLLTALEEKDDHFRREFCERKRLYDENQQLRVEIAKADVRVMDLESSAVLQKEELERAKSQLAKHHAKAGPWLVPAMVCGICGWEEPK